MLGLIQCVLTTPSSRAQILATEFLFRVKCIKLKSDAPPLHWKNWDGVKVYTISALYVEYVEFERFPDNEQMISLKTDINYHKETGGSDFNKY